jgi:hypothetical protein
VHCRDGKHANADPERHAESHTHGDAHANSDRDGDPDPHGDTDADGDRDADPDRHANGNADRDAHRDTNAHAQPNADANTVGFRRRRVQRQPGDVHGDESGSEMRADLAARR